MFLDAIDNLFFDGKKDINIDIKERSLKCILCISGGYYHFILDLY